MCRFKVGKFWIDRKQPGEGTGHHHWRRGILTPEPMEAGTWVTPLYRHIYGHKVVALGHVLRFLPFQKAHPPADTTEETDKYRDDLMGGIAPSFLLAGKPP